MNKVLSWDTPFSVDSTVLYKNSLNSRMQYATRYTTYPLTVALKVTVMNQNHTISLQQTLKYFSLLLYAYQLHYF